MWGQKKTKKKNLGSHTYLLLSSNNGVVLMVKEFGFSLHSPKLTLILFGKNKIKFVPNKFIMYEGGPY
jgi:hypothetical protein